MSLVLIVSIAIRLVAMAWSIVLLRRIRDWRVVFLTVLFGLMATRQTLTLLTEGTSWTILVTGHATELPGLVVSIMALVALLFLDRILTANKRTESALRWSAEWFRKQDDIPLVNRMTKDQFRRRFRAGLIAAWLIPPATGEVGMCFLGFWDLTEAAMSLIRFTGIYVVGWTLVALVVVKRQLIEPTMALVETRHEYDLACVTRLRSFPLVFWGLLGLYSFFGPATVLLSNAVFQGTAYTLGDYAFSAFGVIPFLLIAAFPMFFYLTDLMGRFLAPRGIIIMVAPLWSKVIVLGLFSPVMIDSVLLTYYYKRTGFLPPEAIVLWLTLILIAGASTWVAFRSFRQGLDSLRQPLSATYGSGAGVHPVPTSLDEFGLLARGWSDLLAGREHAERAILERDQRIRDIVDSTDALIYIKDKEGRYLLINQTFERFFSISIEAAVGKTNEEIFPSKIVDAFAESDLEVVRNGKPLEVQEIFADVDGPRTHISRKFPLNNADRQIYGVCTISTDITKRKRAEDALREAHELLEARVRERTAALQVANEDLDSFTYSVSHDLQAPLRHVDGFARILLNEHSNSLDSEAMRHLDTIRKSAKKMGVLIEDLLALARVGGKAIHREAVDCNRLVREVWAELTRASDTARIGFELKPLPVLQADAALLRHVWTNLLDNAIKYSSTCDAPRVVVDSYDEDGTNWYRVQDNGVGFDAQYADKMFGAFQRLHREEDFPGTGVGLAIVQRIVHKHGGQLRGKGEVDKGAVLEFTLGE